MECVAHIPLELLTMPLFIDGNAYNVEIYNILCKYCTDMSNNYIDLCSNLHKPEFNTYATRDLLYNDHVKQFIKYARNNQANLHDYISLGHRQAIFRNVANLISDEWHDKLWIAMIHTTGAAQSMPRFQRAESDPEFMRIIKAPFNPTEADRLFELSGNWCRFIIQTPQYKYGIRPTLADMPRYREILATEDPFELEMIREQASNLPADLRATLPNMGPAALHALCSEGLFYLVFDDIREYRALKRCLQNYAETGFSTTDPLYLEIIMCAPHCPVCLHEPFNLMICPALYKKLSTEYVIEKIAMRWA